MPSARRSSLRASLASTMEAKKKKKAHTSGILKGRNRFRAIVRLVFEYKEWITEDPHPTEEIGDDVAINVKMAQRKTAPEKKGLTLEDRSILLTNPKWRTKEQKRYLSQLVRNLRPYKRYPDNLLMSLGAATRYLYVPPDRVIVRQGHTALGLYYIVKGEVSLSKFVTDPVTGDTTVNDMGVMGPGDMFGEVALLQTIPRSTTVVSKTSVDMLYLTVEDFNKLLRASLEAQWDVLRDALINFNYFKAWNEVTHRECCILSRIKEYEPNEVLLGDGKGMVNYVYFILAGQCRMIEHMVVHEERIGNKVKYKLYDPLDFDEPSKEGGNVGEEQELISGKSERDSHVSQTSQVSQASGAFGASQDSPTSQASQASQASQTSQDARDVKSEKRSEIDYTQLLLSKRPKDVDHERMSIVTTTLQDVVNEWHEITEVAAMLMKEPSTISQQTYPKNVHTIFMQVCLFYRGACFGLGEKMRNRRIVSITSVRCLLIPRYWLLQHNRANIWERVRLFMDSKYPTIDQLFSRFVGNRRWLRYKQEFVQDILRSGRNVPNCTTIHDVPYSIRINEEIDAPS